MPRVRDLRPVPVDPALTGPIEHQRAEPDVDDAGGDPAVMTDPDAVDVPDEGPATMVGAAPAGATAWHRARTATRRRGTVDPGPPTQAGVAPDFDEFDDYDDEPAGLGGADLDDDPDQAPAEGRGSRRRVVESAGQMWAVVLMQWIAGAIGGAVLWVGFRFLWRSLPVVALAAAVLVTVGLVVVVRALLRNGDIRTTVSAVLVGLLLTVSPAILVLMGR